MGLIFRVVDTSGEGAKAGFVFLGLVGRKPRGLVSSCVGGGCGPPAGIRNYRPVVGIHTTKLNGKYLFDLLAKDRLRINYIGLCFAFPIVFPLQFQTKITCTTINLYVDTYACIYVSAYVRARVGVCMYIYILYT